MRERESTGGSRTNLLSEEDEENEEDGEEEEEIYFQTRLVFWLSHAKEKTGLRSHKFFAK